MALLFSLLCGLATLISAYFIYYFSHGHLVDNVEAMIDMDYQHLREWHEIGRLEEHLQHHHTDTKDQSSASLYLLLNSDNTIRLGTLSALPKSLSLLTEGLISFHNEDKEYAAKVYTLHNNEKLLVAVDVTERIKSHRHMQWLGASCIVFMLVVIVCSYMISRFVATRTHRIARTARDIMQTGDLSRRIEVDAQWDDLSNMAQVLNSLLDRIQELMQGVREISDNIAHDLRTPLTRMRSHIERFIEHPEIAEKKEAQQQCDKLLEEADQLLNTFNALLRISRIETAKSKSLFQHHSFSQLVKDVLELYEPLIEEKDIELIKDIYPSDLYGDRDLLFQSVANIIDNAIKFTPQHGFIKVRVICEEEHIELYIEDSGPGISESEHGKIFRRFYRSESSRHTQGNGLGLSLVAAVVDLHDGTIELGSRSTGLLIKLNIARNKQLSSDALNTS